MKLARELNGLSPRKVRHLLRDVAEIRQAIAPRLRWQKYSNFANQSLDQQFGQQGFAQAGAYNPNDLQPMPLNYPNYGRGLF